jgi:hypothetical protein
MGYVKTDIEERIAKALNHLPLRSDHRSYAISAKGSAWFDEGRGDEPITLEEVAKYLEGVRSWFEREEMVVTHKCAVTEANRAGRLRDHLRAFLADEGFEEEERY